MLSYVLLEKLVFCWTLLLVASGDKYRMSDEVPSYARRHCYAEDYTARSNLAPYHNDISHVGFVAEY